MKVYSILWKLIDLTSNIFTELAILRGIVKFKKNPKIWEKLGLARPQTPTPPPLSNFIYFL